MCNPMHNGIKCNDVYLQRCFCGCSKNNTRYRILTPYQDSQKSGQNIRIEIPYLSLPADTHSTPKHLRLIFCEYS